MCVCFFSFYFDKFLKISICNWTIFSKISICLETEIGGIIKSYGLPLCPGWFPDVWHGTYKSIYDVRSELKPFRYNFADWFVDPSIPTAISAAIRWTMTGHAQWACAQTLKFYSYKYNLWQKHVQWTIEGDRAKSMMKIQTYFR